MDKRTLLVLLAVLPVMAVAQYTPKVRNNGYPQFLNAHQDSIGVLRNVGSGTGAYGKVRLGEMDTTALKAWISSQVGQIGQGTQDGNNLTTGISFTNQRLTLTRSGLSNLTADIDTGFVSTVRGVRDSASILRTLINGKQATGDYALNGHTHTTGDVTGLSTALGLKVNYTDTVNMLSPYLRSAAAAATYQPIGSYQPAGSYANATHTHAISDVTSLASSLGLKVNYTDTASMLSPYLRSASAAATYQPIGSYATTSQLSSYVPTTRTINGLDLSANRTLSTSDIGEGTNQYFTNARARSAISLTTTGASGASTYNSTTGALNVPTYTLAGLGGVAVSDTAAMLTPYLRSAAAAATYQPIGSYATTSQLSSYVPTTRTINGLDLSANRTLSTSDIGEGTNQYFTNARARSAVSLTTTGASGSATYNSTSGAFNIPTYTLTGLGGVPTTRTLTINGTALDLSADRSWTISAGATTWGSITGTLSSQTDLQTALNGKASSTHTHPQSDITNLTTDLAGKQATLVSGTNIKTINGQSVLGSGDLTVSGSGAAWGGITGTLSSQTDLQTALDAKANTDDLAAKQDALVNGTNIKTLSGNNILGSGDLDIKTVDIVSRETKGYTYFNEFINAVATTTGGDDVVATNSGTSAASNAQATDAANRIGLVRATTGTTATGRTAVTSAASIIRLGGGAWTYETFLNVTTLSTSTERYQLAIGFFDTYTAANQVDGAYFLYDEGGVSTGSTAAAYWQTVTTSNSGRTFNTSLTQTTVNAATWVKLRIEVNAAGNSVGFYINDALVSTHTANIPTAAGRELGFGYMLIKSAGTTARTVDFDYLSVINTFTTQR